LDDNWSRPAFDGVWTQSDSATITIPVKHVQFNTIYPRSLKMAFTIEASRPTKASIIVNKRKIKTLNLMPNQTLYTLNLPRSFLKSENLLVEFDLEGTITNTLEAKENKARTGKNAPLLQQNPIGSVSHLKLKKLELIASST
jgi:hypothetical protein